MVDKMQIGLVGAPNSGKSTFLKAATLVDVETADYPFTTIDPNMAVGYLTSECPCGNRSSTGQRKYASISKGSTQIVDHQLDRWEYTGRCGFCKNGTRFIPVKLLDVAGLVPGAHKGKGLGNKFLDNLREADVLIHILDISGRTNSKGEKTEDYDPKETVETLEKEIDMWYTNIIKREWKNLSHTNIEEEIAKRFSGLSVTKEKIKESIKEADVDPERPDKWGEEDIFRFAKTLRQKSKPIIIAANKIDLPESGKNYKNLKKRISEEIIPCSAESELALRRAEKENMIDYIPGSSEFCIKGEPDGKQKNALGLIKNLMEKYNGTGVQKCLNKSLFDLLDKIVVYPVENENKWTDSKGKVLPDAYILDRGSTAKDLAYKIHTDIGEGFIGAIDARTNKRISAEKELKDGDVIKILKK